MTPQEWTDYIRRHEVEAADLRYTTLDGRSRHVTIPAKRLATEPMPTGIVDVPGPFDEAAHLAPFLDTAVLDPFCQYPTAVVVCELRQANGPEHPTDPRACARRAEAALRASGVADLMRVRCQLQFHILDQAAFQQTANHAHYLVDSREGAWRACRTEPDNLGLQVRAGAGGHVAPPADSLHNLRAEMAAVMQACGVAVLAHCHGPGTGGQATIALDAAPLVAMADRVMMAKHVIRNVAARHGKTVTFMPQPLWNEPRSEMHVEWQLELGGAALFATGAAGANEGLASVVRSLGEHAHSLFGLTRPTVNGYRGADFAPADRAVAGWTRGGPPNGASETPAWACFAGVDPNCNPYLVLAALAMATRAGFLDRRHASQPAAAPTARSSAWPATLTQALAALQQDRAYLTWSGVFSDAMLERWTAARRAEARDIGTRPHPAEFLAYFDL